MKDKVLIVEGVHIEGRIINIMFKKWNHDQQNTFTTLNIFLLKLMHNYIFIIIIFKMSATKSAWTIIDENEITKVDFLIPK